MEHLILVRYGEIHLKGSNRPYFERLLLQGLKRATEKFGARTEKGDGRYYIRGVSEEDFDAAIKAASRVFGVHSVSPAYEMDKDLPAVYEQMARMLHEKMQRDGIGEATFKVEAKRSDKRFAMKSMELAADAGGYLLEHVPGLKVDVHTPMLRPHIEIRERAYVYLDIIPGKGGMPAGSNGRAMLLLSGGIDSPVAGYMVAKRGVTIEAVHYHSFPYTSERARDKVIKLAREMAEYTGPIKLHIVSFTEIQMEIYEKCPEQQLTILMRRFMMKIAERVARQNECQALVTGESLGQVASQTIESLGVTNAAVDLPVFRPLIGMDKDEIIERAKEIGTFDTSILPYEDCCTVFVPKHPATRPTLEKIEPSEQLLDGEALISRALESVETVWVQ